MKIKTNDVNTGFKPVDLTFTLESKEELAAIYALFNHSRIVNVVHQCGLDAEVVRKEIKSLGIFKERLGSIDDPQIDSIHSRLTREFRA